MSSSSRSRSARPPGSTSAANNTACATGSINSTSSHFSIIPTFIGDPTNPTGSPPPSPGQGAQGSQGGLPQPGIQSSAQLYRSARHEFFHLSLVLRLAALPSFFDLGLTIDTRMGMLSWYYARTVRAVYTFLLLGVPSAIVIATAA
ncbi:hypothetical protein B0H13DRAFT_1909576 [Mycena leptocephala]|nr:hypothetical protein B0H13DRAFT_1909576 [Mycena leptocephala]